MRNVLMLHEVDRGDVFAVTSQIEVEKPYTLYSYTDQLNGTNHHNAYIAEVASEADLILLQESLVRPLTRAAETVIACSAMNGDRQTSYRLFNRGYVLSDEVSGLNPAQQIEHLISSGESV